MPQPPLHLARRTYPKPPAQKDSKFAAAYGAGVHKSKYWDPVYEDSMDLIAKLPQLAARIYTRTYKGGKHVAPDPKLDWAANLSHMMGERLGGGVLLHLEPYKP